MKEKENTEPTSVSLESDSQSCVIHMPDRELPTTDSLLSQASLAALKSGGSSSLFNSPKLAEAKAEPLGWRQEDNLVSLHGPLIKIEMVQEQEITGALIVNAKGLDKEQQTDLFEKIKKEHKFTFDSFQDFPYDSEGNYKIIFSKKLNFRNSFEFYHKNRSEHCIEISQRQKQGIIEIGGKEFAYSFTDFLCTVRRKDPIKIETPGDDVVPSSCTIS